ncbi:DUF982 domain-containing protein [Ochrobactrum teleogrylli]|uniref:DUF982 domain-containing protein n=1 Tax=Ochrobactrum teleogrylli TaxID=2479765 RepID=UPI00384C7835
MAWGEPVDVELFGTGKHCTVTNTAMAAEYLLEEWPHEARGAEFWRAIENCLADLENKPNTARECFIAAIKAADVSARPPALPA